MVTITHGGTPHLGGFVPRKVKSRRGGLRTASTTTTASATTTEVWTTSATTTEVWTASATTEGLDSLESSTTASSPAELLPSSTSARSTGLSVLERGGGEASLSASSIEDSLPDDRCADDRDVNGRIDALSAERNARRLRTSSPPLATAMKLGTDLTERLSSRLAALPRLSADAASGSATHQQILNSLADCRAKAMAISCASSDGSGRPQLLQPRVARRRMRRSREADRDRDREARARLIQQSWRRRQAERVIADCGVRRDLGKDFTGLLAHLVQSAPRRRSVVPSSVVPALTSPSSQAGGGLGLGAERERASCAPQGSPMEWPPSSIPSWLPSSCPSTLSSVCFSSSPSFPLDGDVEAGRRHGSLTDSADGGGGGIGPGREDPQDQPPDAAKLRPPPPTPANSFLEDPAEVGPVLPVLRLPPNPDVAIAKEYASSIVLRQTHNDERPGELYPLYTSLRSFDRFGTDLSQYMHFMYWTARLFFALFMLNLSNLVINWEGRQLVHDQFEVNSVLPAALTFHTLGNAAVSGVLGQGAHSYGIIEFFTSGILVCYLFYLRGRFDEIHMRIRNSHGGQLLTAADFTVMVSDIPAAWSSQQVRDFFEKFGEVVHVGFSLNYRELILKIQRARRLREAHTNACLNLLQHMGQQMGPLERTMGFFSARRRARSTLLAVEDNRKTIRKLMRLRYRCTGYAFVTFNKYQVAQAVCDELPKSLQGRGASARVSYLFGGRMRVCRAPEPEDLLWENLQFSTRQQYVRQVISSVLGLILVLVGTIAIFAANLYVAPGMMIKVDSFPVFLGLYLASVLLLAGGHLIVFVVVPVLAHKFERHHTNAARELSIMLKLSFFMCFNTIINAVLFLFPAFSTRLNPSPNYYFSPGWYVTGGQVVIMSILGDLLVVNLGMDLFRPGDMFRRRTARRAKTQQQMNELYACSGAGILPFRICILSKAIVVGSMFSFALPILHMIVAIYIWMGHWVDRYIFLRRVTPPPASHSVKQMNFILTYTLPLAILYRQWASNPAAAC